MRVKIEFPAKIPLAILTIPVRIGDINYGGHVGNDAFLSIIHEARVQALARGGFSELEAGGTSLIMADSAIAYRSEAYYGDVLRVEVFATGLSARSFDLLYRIKTQRTGMEIVVAEGKTGMVCFDYTSRKISLMTDALKQFLSGLEN